MSAAGQFKVDDYTNVWIGIESLSDDAGIQSNTIGGYGAGFFANGSVSSNVLLGPKSGVSLTVAEDNTLLGAAAGGNSSNVVNNAFLGVGAGYASSNVSSDVGIGHSSHQNQTGASKNVFVGYGAGWSQTEVSGNVANVGIGDGVFQQTTGAVSNTAIGFLTLSVATQVSGNILIGNVGGRGLSGVEHCIAVGTSSISKSSGTSNVLIGSGTTMSGATNTVGIGDSLSYDSVSGFVRVGESIWVDGASNQVLFGDSRVPVTLAPSYVNVLSNANATKANLAVTGGIFTPDYLHSNITNPVAGIPSTTPVFFFGANSTVQRIRVNAAATDATDFQDSVLEARFNVPITLVNNTYINTSGIGQFLLKKDLDAISAADAIPGRTIRYYRKVLFVDPKANGGSGNSFVGYVPLGKRSGTGGLDPQSTPDVDGGTGTGTVGPGGENDTTGKDLLVVMGSNESGLVFKTSVNDGTSFVDAVTSNWPEAMTAVNGTLYVPQIGALAYGASVSGNAGFMTQNYTGVSNQGYDPANGIALTSLTYQLNFSGTSISFYDAIYESSNVYTIGTRHNSNCIFKLSGVDPQTSTPAGTGADLFETGYSLGNNGLEWIAAGYGGTVGSNNLYRSEDFGANWSAVDTGDKHTKAYKVAWSGEAWVSVGDATDEGTYPILTCKLDRGFTWKKATITLDDTALLTPTVLKSVAWSGTAWIAVGGTSVVRSTSPTADYWVSYDFSDVTEDLNSVVWVQSAAAWFLVGKKVYKSTNGGITWTEVTAFTSTLSEGTGRIQVVREEPFIKPGGYLGRRFPEIGPFVGQPAAAAVFGTTLSQTLSAPEARIIHAVYSVNPSITLFPSTDVPVDPISANRPNWGKVKNISGGVVYSALQEATGSLPDYTRTLYAVNLSTSQEVPTGIYAQEKSFPNLDAPTPVTSPLAICRAIYKNASGYLAVGEGISGQSTIALAGAPADDPFTWNARPSPLIRAYAAAYNGSYWIAVGEGKTPIAKSTDGGIGWTGHIASLSSVRSVAWNGQLWIAVGQGSNGIACGSLDGETWFDLSIEAGMTLGHTVEWNKSRWVIGGEGTNTMVYVNRFDLPPSAWTPAGVPRAFNVSTNEVNVSMAFPTRTRGIVWNGMDWIACGDGNSVQIARSGDGIYWYLERPSVRTSYTTDTTLSTVTGIASFFNRNLYPPSNVQTTTLLYQYFNDLQVDVSARASGIKQPVNDGHSTYTNVLDTVSTVYSYVDSISTTYETMSSFMSNFINLSRVWSTLCDTDLSAISISSISAYADAISAWTTMSNLGVSVNSLSATVSVPLAKTFVDSVSVFTTSVNLAVSAFTSWVREFVNVNELKTRYELSMNYLYISGLSLQQTMSTEMITTISTTISEFKTLSAPFYTSLSTLSAINATNNAKTRTGLSAASWYAALETGITNNECAKIDTLSTLVPRSGYVEARAYVDMLSLNVSLNSAYTTLSSKQLSDAVAYNAYIVSSISTMSTFLTNVSVDSVSRYSFLNVITTSLNYLISLNSTLSYYVAYSQSNFLSNYTIQKEIDYSNMVAQALAAENARIAAAAAAAAAVQRAANVAYIINLLSGGGFSSVSSLVNVSAYSVSLISLTSSINTNICDYPAQLSLAVTKDTYDTIAAYMGGIQYDSVYFGNASLSLGTAMDSVTGYWNTLQAYASNEMDLQSYIISNSTSATEISAAQVAYDTASSNLSFGSMYYSNALENYTNTSQSISQFINIYTQAVTRRNLYLVSETIAAQEEERVRLSNLSVAYIKSVSDIWTQIRRYKYINFWTQQQTYALVNLYPTLSFVDAQVISTDPSLETLGPKPSSLLLGTPKRIRQYESILDPLLKRVLAGGKYISDISENLSLINNLSSNLYYDMFLFDRQLTNWEFPTKVPAHLLSMQYSKYTYPATIYNLPTISAGLHSNFLSYFSDSILTVSTQMKNICEFVAYQVSQILLISEENFPNGFNSQVQFYDTRITPTLSAYSVSVNSVQRAFLSREDDFFQLVPTTMSYISTNLRMNLRTGLSQVAETFVVVDCNRPFYSNQSYPDVKYFTSNGVRLGVPGYTMVSDTPYNRYGLGGGEYLWTLSRNGFTYPMQWSESDRILNALNYTGQGKYFEVLNTLSSLSWVLDTLSTISSYGTREYAATISLQNEITAIGGISSNVSLNVIRNYYSRHYNTILEYLALFANSNAKFFDILSFTHFRTVSFKDVFRAYYMVSDPLAKDVTELTDVNSYWNMVPLNSDARAIGGISGLSMAFMPELVVGTYPPYKVNDLVNSKQTYILRAIQYHFTRATEAFNTPVGFLGNRPLVESVEKAMFSNVEIRGIEYRRLAPGVLSKYYDLVKRDTFRSNRFAPYSLGTIETTFKMYSYKPNQVNNYYGDIYNASTTAIANYAWPLRKINLDNLYNQYEDARQKYLIAIRDAAALNVNINLAVPPPGQRTQQFLAVYNIAVDASRNYFAVLNQFKTGCNSYFGQFLLSFDQKECIDNLSKSRRLISDVYDYVAGADSLYLSDLSSISAMYISNAYYFLSSISGSITATYPNQTDYDLFKNSTYAGSSNLSYYVSLISSNISTLSALCATDLTGYSIVSALEVVDAAKATRNTISATLYNSPYTYMISTGIPMYYSNLSYLLSFNEFFKTSISRWTAIHKRCLSLGAYDFKYFPPESGQGSNFVMSVKPTNLSFWMPLSDFNASLNSISKFADGSLNFTTFATRVTSEYYNWYREYIYENLSRAQTIYDLQSLDFVYTQLESDLLTRPTTYTFSGVSLIAISSPVLTTATLLSSQKRFLDSLSFIGISRTLISSVSATFNALSTTASTLSIPLLILSLQDTLSKNILYGDAMKNYLAGLSSNELLHHEYDNNWAYYKGDVVSFSGQLYILHNVSCPPPKTGISGVDPTNSNYWEFASNGYSNISSFVYGGAHTEGTVVVRDGDAFVCISSHISGSAVLPNVDPARWAVIPQSNYADYRIPAYYDSNKFYYSNNTVTYRYTTQEYDWITGSIYTRSVLLPYRLSNVDPDRFRKYEYPTIIGTVDLDQTTGYTLLSDMLVRQWEFFSGQTIKQTVYRNVVYNAGTTLSLDISYGGVKYLSGTTLSQTISAHGLPYYTVSQVLNSGQTISNIILLSGQKDITVQVNYSYISGGTCNLYNVPRYGLAGDDLWGLPGFARDQRYAFAIGPETACTRLTDQMYRGRIFISGTADAIYSGYGTLSQRLRGICNLEYLPFVPSNVSATWSNVQLSYANLYTAYTTTISDPESFQTSLTELQTILFGNLFSMISFCFKTASEAIYEKNLIKTRYWNLPSTQKRVYDNPVDFINPVQSGSNRLYFEDQGCGRLAEFTSIENPVSQKRAVDEYYAQSKALSDYDNFAKANEAFVKDVIGFGAINYLANSRRRLYGGILRCDSFANVGNARDEAVIYIPLINSTQNLSLDIENPSNGTFLWWIRQFLLKLAEVPDYVNDSALAAALTYEPSDPTVKALGAVAKGCVGVLASAFQQAPTILFTTFIDVFGIADIIDAATGATSEDGKGVVAKYITGSIKWPGFRDFNNRLPQAILRKTAADLKAISAVNRNLNAAQQIYFLRELEIELEKATNLLAKARELPIPPEPLPANTIDVGPAPQGPLRDYTADTKVEKPALQFGEPPEVQARALKNIDEINERIDFVKRSLNGLSYTEKAIPNGVKNTLKKGAASVGKGLPPVATGGFAFRNSGNVTLVGANSRKPAASGIVTASTEATTVVDQAAIDQIRKANADAFAEYNLKKSTLEKALLDLENERLRACVGNEVKTKLTNLEKAAQDAYILEQDEAYENSVKWHQDKMSEFMDDLAKQEAELAEDLAKYEGELESYNKRLATAQAQNAAEAQRVIDEQAARARAIDAKRRRIEALEDLVERQELNLKNAFLRNNRIVNAVQDLLNSVVGASPALTSAIRRLQTGYATVGAVVHRATAYVASRRIVLAVTNSIPGRVAGKAAGKVVKYLGPIGDAAGIFIGAMEMGAFE